MPSGVLTTENRVKGLAFRSEPALLADHTSTKGLGPRFYRSDLTLQVSPRLLVWKDSSALGQALEALIVAWAPR